MVNAAEMDTVENHFKPGNRCLVIITGQRFLVGIQSVQEDTVRLSYPAADFPVAGMLLEIEFHDDLGYARFESEILATPENVGDGLLIRLPTEYSRTTQRGAWRIPTDFNVILKSHVHPRRYEVPVVNLSAGGMLLQTNADAELNDTVELKFHLPGEAAPQEMLGTIVHVHQPDNKAGGETMVGINFINPEPQHRKALSRYVWRRLREIHPDDLGFKGKAQL